MTGADATTAPACRQTIVVERGGSPEERAARLHHLARIVSADLGRWDTVNQGRARRRKLGGLDHERGLRLECALFVASASGLPFEVDVLEKHPRTEQMILPIDAANGWIVLVAPDRDSAPDLDRAVAVQLGAHEGIVYGKGVWHLPVLLEGAATGLFLVQSMQDGTPADCVEYPGAGISLVG